MPRAARLSRCGPACRLANRIDRCTGLAGVAAKILDYDLCLRISRKSFSALSRLCVLAMNCVFDSISVSMMRRRLARSDEPVSVTSTIASASTGGFTSVAPQENSTLTFTFFAAK